jgi:hypothetical protein
MAHTVAELEKMLAEAKAKEAHQEFPKFVKPHKSHVRVKKTEGAPDHVSAPAFSEVHVDRVTNDVTVLVNDADEEKKALSELKVDAPKVEPVKMDPPKLVEPPAVIPQLSEVKPT